MPKLVFLALNLGGLALGIWKVIKIPVLSFLLLSPFFLRQHGLIIIIKYCFLIQRYFTFAAQHFGASPNTCIRLGFVLTPSSG